MAATISGILFSQPVSSTTCASASRRRRIGPSASRALQTLGHAIEYLTTASAPTGAFRLNDDCIQAVELLMSLNRQVYMECPEAPSIRERWRAFVSGRAPSTPED